MNDREVPDPSPSEGGPAVEAAEDPLMWVDVSRGPGVAIIAVAGEVDQPGGARLADVLTAELDGRPEVLVVDLDRVSLLTSVGLAALALAHRSAQAQGTGMRVVAGTHAALRPLQITGMSDDLAVYANRRDALAGRPGDDPTARSRHG